MNRIWIQTGITVVGGNGQGNRLNQLSHRWDINIDHDQTIYMTDRSNYRKGRRQLNNPLNVIVDKESDSLIICDNRNKRIVRRSHQNDRNEETIICKIARGD